MGKVTVNFFFAVILMLQSCAFTSSERSRSDQEKEHKIVYVISYGWHSGLVIKNENLGSELNFVKRYLGESAYYEFGWGDSIFYQADDITLANIVQALFWPGSSVMRVMALSQEPTKFLSQQNVIAVELAESDHHVLNENIASSFKRDALMQHQFIALSKFGFSAFFSAKGCYSMLNTCNSWTAGVLKNSNVPFESPITLTSGNLMEQLKHVKQE